MSDSGVREVENLTKRSIAIALSIVLVTSMAAPFVGMPVGVAAAVDGDVDFNDDASDPTIGTELEPGKEYSFDIVVSYQLPDGKQGSVQLYIPDMGGGYSTTKEVEGTGEYEEVTFSVTETVPQDLAGDSLYMSTTLEGPEGDTTDVDEATYPVGEGENSPPEIEDYSPSEDLLKITAGETIDFSAESSDADGDSLTHTWHIRDIDEEDSFSQVASESGSTTEYSHTFEDSGAYAVKVKVSDGSTSNDHVWNVDVSKENQDRPPTIEKLSPSDSGITITEGDSRDFEVEVSDPDADLETVEFRLDGKVVHTHHLGSDSTQRSDWQKTFEDPGTYTVEAVVTDSNENSDSVWWDVSVEQESTPEPTPTETPTPEPTPEPTPTRTPTPEREPDGDVEIDNDDSDPSFDTSLEPGKEYTFEIQVGRELSNADGGTLKLFFPDVGGQVGSKPVEPDGDYETSTFTVTKTVPQELAGDTLYVSALLDTEDGEFVAGDDQSYTVETGENAPPTIDDYDPSEKALEAVEGEEVDFSVESSDADGDSLTHTWYIRDLDESGGFSQLETDSGTSAEYSHRFDESGDYAIKVEVSDGQTSNDHVWTVAVGKEDQDRQPTIDSLSPSSDEISLDTDESEEFGVEVSDPDADLETVEYFVEGEREHRHHLGDGSPQTSDWQREFSEPGEYEVEAVVTDSNGNTDSISWEVSVGQEPTATPTDTPRPTERPTETPTDTPRPTETPTPVDLEAEGGILVNGVPPTYAKDEWYTVQVRVRNTGETDQRFTVEIMEPTGTEIQGSATQQIEVEPRTTKRVEFQLQFYGTDTAREVTVRLFSESGERLDSQDIESRPASAREGSTGSLVVSTGRSGESVSDYLVQVFPDDLSVSVKELGSDGKVEFKDVPTGKHVVFLSSKEDEIQKSKKVQIEPGEQSRISIDTSGLAQIQGSVESKDGKAVDGVIVEINNQRAETGQNGGFSFESQFETTHYVATVYKDSTPANPVTSPEVLWQGTVTLDRGNNELDITLPVSLKELQKDDIPEVAVDSLSHEVTMGLILGNAGVERNFPGAHTHQYAFWNGFRYGASKKLAETGQSLLDLLNTRPIETVKGLIALAKAFHRDLVGTTGKVLAETAKGVKSDVWDVPVEERREINPYQVQELRLTFAAGYDNGYRDIAIFLYLFPASKISKGSKVSKGLTKVDDITGVGKKLEKLKPKNRKFLKNRFDEDTRRRLLQAKKGSAESARRLAQTGVLGGVEEIYRKYGNRWDLSKRGDIAELITYASLKKRYGDGYTIHSNVDINQPNLGEFDHVVVDDSTGKVVKVVEVSFEKGQAESKATRLVNHLKDARAGKAKIVASDETELDPNQFEGDVELEVSGPDGYPKTSVESGDEVVKIKKIKNSGRTLSREELHTLYEIIKEKDE